MVGAKVELVFEATDPIGRKSPRVRSALTDSTGVYRICGLPGDMTGKVQVFRNGVSSGEVPAEVTNGFLALRGFSIVSQHQAVVEVVNDSGKVRRIAKGSAKVTGRVLDKKGQPLVTFPAHNGPNDIAFYTGSQFPAKYRNGAFVALHGSWNRAPFDMDGYRVVFVPFGPKGPTGSWEPFADGFPGKTAFKTPREAVYRPTGLAVGAAGELYISDDAQGRIWRVVAR